MSMPSTSLPAPGKVSAVVNDPRLSGRWLVLARATWVTLVILTLVVFFGSMPEYLVQLATPCARASCVYQQLTPGQVKTLQGIGLSASDYALYTVLFTIVCMGVSLGISALLIWRRSDDRMALFVALMLATFGTVIENGRAPIPFTGSGGSRPFFRLLVPVLLGSKRTFRMKHKRAYQYRCYPTPSQRQTFARTFGCARFVYNWGLRLRTDAYRQRGATPLLR